jgi:hypothetical protein
MSEKGQGQNAGASPGAAPGSGEPPAPKGGDGPPPGGDPKPVDRPGGGAKAPEKKPPNPNPPSGTLEFPDGGRLTGEGGKWRYTDPNGRTGLWTGDGWVDEGSGQSMPDDFKGRAPDPNRVREGRDW